MTVENNTPENTDQEATEAPQEAPEASEATPTAPKPAPPAEQPPADPEAEVEDKGDEKTDKVGNEAAKYRRQLRSTEAERDTLTGTVDTLRKQLINQNLPRISKVNGDALWATGRTPDEFFTDAGEIDTDKLSTAIKETHQALGIHWGLDPIPDAGTGDRSGISEVTWADALKKK